MFGRTKPIGGRSNGTFGRFLVNNAVLLGITFVLAFFLAAQMIQYFGWFLTPLSNVLGMLYPPLNDPFFISYLTIYALLQIVVMFFRFKTGSRI